MRTELGQTSLAPGYFSQPSDEFIAWFRTCVSIDSLIDGLEVAVRIAGVYAKRSGERKIATYEDDLKLLNARMLEDGFGYQINDNQIIQISSTFIHENVTIPAFNLLSSSLFAVANDEFRQAYSEFNQGNYDDCIHDCCNAFESTLKIILADKSWPFDSNKDTASKLLNIAFENDLIPNYMQTEFTGLRTILESGVPTIRNKAGGHGAGAVPRDIPKYIAAFQLNQTAAAIVLLVEAASR